MTPAENVPVALPLRQLSLEITGKCNLTCSHCYAESGPRLSLRGEMATADWLRLIDEARRARLPRRHLHRRRAHLASRPAGDDRTGRRPRLRADRGLHQRHPPAAGAAGHAPAARRAARRLVLLH